MINAPHDKEFHFQDGTHAKNLLELVSKLETMADHEFHHFVNPHKNDFANWVEHVLSDKPFADKLREIHSRDEIVQLIKDRIADFTIGNSIIKIPKIEDHSPGHALMHEHPQVSMSHESSHDDIHREVHEQIAKESIASSGSLSGSTPITSETVHDGFTHEHRAIPEPHVLDGVPPLVMGSRHRERDEEGKSRRKWFRFMSKKNVSENDLVRMGNEESEKLRPEKELGDEIYADEKENALWTVLYIVLIILIISLLAYKLFM